MLAPLRASGDAALDSLNRIGAGAVAFLFLTFAVGGLGALYAAVYVPVLVTFDQPRRQQLSLVRAREIARVTVRPVLSRTLNELGPTEEMLIYGLPRR